MATENKTDVLQFMSLRSPQSLSDKKLRISYIQDDEVGEEAGIGVRKPREVFSSNSSSEVGEIIYKNVFASLDNAPVEINQDIIQELLSLLDSKTVPLAPNEEASLVTTLANSSYIRIDQTFYLVPTNLESILLDQVSKKMRKANSTIKKHADAFNRRRLIKDLTEIFEGNNLWEAVFYPKRIFDPTYANIKSKLFDTLYLLHVLRRKVSVSLEDVIAGLKVLHVLEYMAIDSFLYSIYTGRVDPNTDAQAKSYLDFFKNIYPEVKKADPSKTSSERFYYIKDKLGLKEFFEAIPMVHPIVAELGYFGKPRFNNIKPYLGDLKVVKQWLVGYKIGEISYIHNIMKGEEKERNHRYLEKTEDIFSFSSDSSQSTQTEATTNDRYEVKREAERVIKTDVNVGATANMTYKYGDVFSASAGANFAYANSNQDSQKTSLNYAREVLSKAVTNIQNRVTQQRSVSKLYESEEINNHKLTNIQPGATHTSGIYRWLDKKYKAQLYNFGQRWMFEFTIPEPAAFFVTSKLKAAEFDFEELEKPSKPDYESVKIIKPGTTTTELQPVDINETVFNALRLKYDLAEFEYPRDNYWVPFTDKQKGNNDLSKDLLASWAGNMVWTNSQFRSSIPKGYDVNAVSIVGNVQFLGSEDNLSEDWELNKLLFMLNGYNIKDIRNDSLEKSMTVEYLKLDEVIEVNPAVRIPDGEVILDLNFQDLARFSVMVYLRLKVNDGHMQNWRIQVYSKIRAIEDAAVSKRNQDLEITYNAKLSDYNNKLDSYKTKILNDLIQGKSEAFNSQVITEELKKHCITMIAKEFDFTTYNDDQLSDKDAIENASVNITYDKFVVEERDEQVTTSAGTKTVTKAFVGFKTIDEAVNYPKIDIPKSNFKARYIQFIEQAFEWQHLAYIFHSYFWAHESKWIKLMNRLDYTDNNMTAFLKAGSARVVVAVTPGYYNAVMHFLATREPWEGGDLPVIGDPLFVPIYEEIKNKQDDLENATPEGKPWEFELPTSLVYLQDSSSPIPTDLIGE